MPRRKQRRRLLPLICGCTIALLVGLQVGFHGDAAPPAAAPPPAAPLPRPRSLAELRAAATSLERKLEGLAAREAGVARQEADAAWRELRHLGDALRAAATREAAAAAAAPPAPPAPPTPPVKKSAPAAAAPGLGAETALLVVAFDRAAALRTSLGAVVRHHPCGRGPRLLISQDAGGGPRWREARAEIDAAAAALGRRCPSLERTRVVTQPDDGKGGDGYHRLARHFRKALTEAFADARTARVIVLEEDLEIAPDFFGFFAAVAPVVDGDASILAASAWNDNGQRRHVDVAKDIARVERSDFFGGLGWMLARRVWEELGPKWPDAYWDDWLREPEQRRNRHVVRPVVCRTFHVKSTRGTSGGQYSHFLSDIVLSESSETVFDVDDVRSSAAADARLFAKLEAAPRVDLGDVLAGSARGTVRVEYDGSFAAYAALARRLGAMDNEKAGVPRGAYRGVVELRRGPVSVLLSPPLDRVRALAAGAAYARP